MNRPFSRASRPLFRATCEPESYSRSLGLGRREGKAFSQADIGFLTQVASQIAIGSRERFEYEQITEARERLAEQKFYLENEIRREHNFEEIIGNSPNR